MASVALIFQRPAATDAHLVFGAGDDAPPAGGLVTISAAATLPTLGLAALLRASVPGSAAAALPALSAAGELRYRSQTARPTVGAARTAHQQAQAGAASARAPHQTGRPLAGASTTPWARAGSHSSAIWHGLPPRLLWLARSLLLWHQDATGLGAEAQAEHADALRIARQTASAYHEATDLRAASHYSSQDATRTRAARRTRWQAGSTITRGWYGAHQLARVNPLGWAARHQDARRPPAGLSIFIVPPPLSHGCYTPSARLLFSAASGASAALLFRCDCDAAEPFAPVIVPIRRVYIVTNTVLLTRAADAAPIPIYGLTLAIDAASWCWSFSASAPASAHALVAPAAGQPTELLATINGSQWRLWAEDITRERSFGDARITISGRSHSAELSAPYAPVLSFAQPAARTAQQLMDDVLTLNGVPIGWAVDWGLTDWLIPAGAFAHQGTWIEAALAIAQVAGGYIQPHRTAKTLRVRHLWPSAPWQWGSLTPDLELPADVTQRETLRWERRPAYNRVFVSGQHVGVLGQVTRAGTAGDLLAPMVVDPLVTHADAARQRGRAILSDTGEQIHIGLRLPVLDATGVIDPGTLLRYNDGDTPRLGLARGVRVEAGFPEVWQTIDVISPVQTA